MAVEGQRLALAQQAAPVLVPEALPLGPDVDVAHRDAAADVDEGRLVAALCAAHRQARVPRPMRGDAVVRRRIRPGGSGRRRPRARIRRDRYVALGGGDRLGGLKPKRVAGCSSPGPRREPQRHGRAATRSPSELCQEPKLVVVVERRRSCPTAMQSSSRPAGLTAAVIIRSRAGTPQREHLAQLALAGEVDAESEPRAPRRRAPAPCSPCGRSRP